MILNVLADVMPEKSLCPPSATLGVLARAPALRSLAKSGERRAKNPGARCAKSDALFSWARALRLRCRLRCDRLVNLEVSHFQLAEKIEQQRVFFGREIAFGLLL